MTKDINVQLDRIRNNFLVRRWKIIEKPDGLESSNGLGDTYSVSVNQNVWAFSWVKSSGPLEYEEHTVCLNFKHDVCNYALGTNRHIGNTLEQIVTAFISDLMQFKLIGRDRKLLFF